MTEEDMELEANLNAQIMFGAVQQIYYMDDETLMQRYLNLNLDNYASENVAFFLLGAMQMAVLERGLSTK